MADTPHQPVSQSLGEALADAGVEHLFGVVGSGNFRLAAAAVAAGVRYVAARHEAGAVAMADGYARTSGRVGVATVHQGPGFTNALTPLVEAAKSRTPLVLLAADSARGDHSSNFALDQATIARATGATVIASSDARDALSDLECAMTTAREQRRTVVLLLPIDVQAESASSTDRRLTPTATASHRRVGSPATDSVDELVRHLRASSRPVLIAGRGAVVSGAGPSIRRLAEVTGALVGTTALAKSLFRDDPFDLGVLGGFASPTTARIVPAADLVVAFGASLNDWTTRHGDLFGRDASIIQVDDDPTAIGVHRAVDVAVVGDAASVADAVADQFSSSPKTAPSSWRTPAMSERLRCRWRDEPYDDRSTAERIDPRTFTRALADCLPDEITMASDSGHFVAWPAIYLDVPDPAGFVFAQAFQSVGLGLGTAIGAHLGRPSRLTVVPIGDGGGLMSVGELETLGRLAAPLLVLVYNDAAYGAEVHHFGESEIASELARFPETDFAAVARSFGCRGITVRRVADVDQIADWVSGRPGPLVVDVKVEPSVVVSFLEEAFRGE
jgi:thiamine pyrophosphate-dependent acetolactate synthase large subunit-like protein